MVATEALRRGDLKTALAELQDEVRARPQDPASRVFLFQLLAVLGDWDRALKQLSVCTQLDPATEIMSQAYSQTIRCEILRSQVFAGTRTPMILGEPPAWVALLLQSLASRSAGKQDEADRLRDQAFEDAPSGSGTLRWRTAGTGAEETVAAAPFEWLADADPRLGPILEAIIDGRYYWVPCQHLQAVRLEPPTDLRDLVWLPAQFTIVGGGQQLGFIPTRYPGSETSQDDAIRLSRKTEWVGEEPGGAVGLGQRLIATDQNEYPLLDIREIQWASADQHGATADSSDMTRVSGDPS
ncbi:MAG: virulence protein SciE type [Planctomycetaceae bacterium]|nr:MAG: virulence protein SciE type [Planctomycetaceae bacterium]